MTVEPRARLSRDRVLRAAVDLADHSGVEAVTMRRLGEELGFEAMSLYRHVANKDDLLDGMLDLVLAEWKLPDGEEEWTEAIRMTARSVHDGLRRHPWAARLLTTGAGIRPARLRYMEYLLGVLRGAGFDADNTYHLYHLVDGHIFGFSLWEIAYTTAASDTEAAATLMRAVPWDEYPQLAEHRDQHMSDGGHQEVSAFEVGLDMILDGLQEVLAPTSAGSGRAPAV
jgi:AcrR family transcriptional regulator